MSILVDRKTRVLVQGITGREGAFHAARCKEYGTRGVGGVTPGKGGTTHEGFHVWNTVAEAVAAEGGTCALIFVPPPAAGGAITQEARGGAGSGTLTYEVVGQLTSRGIGQSTCVGIGGDPVNGTSFVDVLRLFNDDPETRAIMMIGEIGGTAEEEAAAFIKAKVKKPIVAFICGQTAPPGRRMGHAGAIIAGGKGTAAEKMKALEEAGATLVKSPADMGATMAKVIGR